MACKCFGTSSKLPWRIENYCGLSIRSISAEDTEDIFLLVRTCNDGTAQIAKFEEAPLSKQIDRCVFSIHGTHSKTIINSMAQSTQRTEKPACNLVYSWSLCCIKSFNCLLDCCTRF